MLTTPKLATVTPASRSSLKLFTEKAQAIGLSVESSWWKQSVLYFDETSDRWTVEMHVNAGVPRVAFHAKNFDELVVLLWYKRNSRL